jgi:hypothetical protein
VNVEDILHHAGCGIPATSTFTADDAVEPLLDTALSKPSPRLEQYSTMNQLWPMWDFDIYQRKEHLTGWEQ